MRISELRKALWSDDAKGQEIARLLKKIKVLNEQYSKVRNKIAYSRCAGYWRHDSNYIIFTTFEKFESGLALDWVYIEILKEAAGWGSNLLEIIVSTVEAIDTTRGS